MSRPIRVTTAAACLGHDPGPPEQILRLTAVLDRLALDGRFRPVESAPAETASLELVHPTSHVEMLRQQARHGLSGGEEVPLTAASWPAITGAVGAVIDAVEYAVTNGDNAFAAIRPPGHHAGIRTSMGFCAVNNIAIAAAHSRVLGLERVLIIDWDVHHGNGTQEIVWEDPLTRFVSMHQANWYPGTGAATDTGVGNIRNIPLPPGLPRTRYVQEFWDGIEYSTADWSPELVLISAGYDSLAGDPLGGFTLEPDDYSEWVSLLRQRWPEVPIVAAMEGGYAPERLAEGVLSTVSSLAR